MVFALDAQNHIVGGEVDLHHNVFRGKLLQQFVRTVFIHHIHPMTDALRVAQFDGFANMEFQSIRRHQSRREFARVQRHAHLGINAVEIIQHLHVQVIVAHGKVAIFRHHKVQTHYPRIDRGKLKSK